MKQRFFAFIKERQSIHDRRVLDCPKPWTKDKILQRYRFCNVHREDDAVTQWLSKNWRTPHRDDPDLWFAFVVARHINRPDTLEQLGYCVPWNIRRYYKVMRERQEYGLKIYNPAYMIVPSATKAPKNEYLEEQVYTPLWKARKKVRPTESDTLQSFFERLTEFRGMGRFMSAQVIADIKYVKPLYDADDWMTFAASGPGSRRGMNRLWGREVNASVSESKWKEELLFLQRQPEMTLFGIHAQDLQNCLCEFDKYERARLGQGKPKQRYQGV